MKSGVVYCGIDPGLTGAIAFILPNGTDTLLHDMPTVSSEYENGTVKRRVSARGVADIIQEAAKLAGTEVVMTIERQQGRGGFNASTSFSMGHTYGVIQAAIDMIGLEHVSIEAKKWRKILGLIGKDKQVMIDAAKRLYPGADIRLKKHHNRAEALLIARAGIHIKQGATG